jgi:hypothetical protein
VVIVGQIVAGNLHCYAVELDIRTLGDRLGEGILRQRRIVATRLKRLDGKLRPILALALKLTLKFCLRLRLLLRGIMLFLWLTHNELLFAYEHRRHFEIADLSAPAIAKSPDASATLVPPTTAAFFSRRPQM